MSKKGYSGPVLELIWMIIPVNILPVSGIYVIFNKKNSKRYIGSSVNCRKRSYGHLSDLRKNRHSSTHLQNAWNQDGSEQFDFFIIEESEPDLLLKREKYWISHYEAKDPRSGYNVADPERRMLGYKHSEETKIKMMKTLPKAWAANAKVSRRKIKCIETGELFEDANCAAKNMKLNRRSICRVANGERKSHKGFSFQYLDENSKKTNILNKGGKSILCLETGIIYESIAEAARQHNTSRDNIDCAIRRHTRFKGYTFTYLSCPIKKTATILSNKPKQVKCLETGVIYENCAKAAKELKISSGGSSVARQAKGIYSHVNGYHFSFI